MGRIQSIGAFFEALFDGDPVAVGFALGFLALLAVAFVFVWWVNRRMKADDARWKEKMRKKRGY
ncbi:MAG TPA: hypothetical protein VMZ71_02630 [Gemmataceae bacterium]|nr:hypothetical protein [Gemmataceae bacterium]